MVSHRSSPMNNASTAKHKHTCTTDPWTPEQVVEFHRVAATILGDPRKCIMTCLTSLASYLSSPQRPQSQHTGTQYIFTQKGVELHSAAPGKSCCNGILSWPLHASGCPGFCQHAAPSVSIIHQGLTMQCSTISTQKKHSCKEVQIRFQAQLIFSLSSQLFWWQNIPVQWHAGAPARRHSRPYLAQLLEICLLR